MFIGSAGMAEIVVKAVYACVCGCGKLELPKAYFLRAKKETENLAGIAHMRLAGMRVCRLNYDLGQAS